MFRKYVKPVLKVIGFILVYFIVSLILGLIIGEFTKGSLQGNMPLALALGLGACLFTLFIYLKLDNYKLKDIGFGFEKGWLAKLITGSLEGILIMSAIIAVLVISGLGAIRGLDITEAAAVIKNLAIGVVTYLFAVAITEELITRGYIYHYLKSKFTVTGAIFVTSLIFSMMHVLNANFSFIAFFNIFLAGVVINLLVLRDNSLWSAIGFHFGWNYTMGVIFSSPVSGNEKGGVINLALKGSELLTGGNFGIEGGIICTFALLLFGAYAIFYNTRRAAFARGFRTNRNRIFAGIMAVLFIAVIVLDVTSWMPGPIKSDSSTVNQVSRFPNANDYSLNLYLDTNAKTLEGVQTVDYINNTNTTLKEIYFHIYPNGFQALGGGININGITVNDKNARYTLECADKSMVRVYLDEPLNSGERDSVYFKYSIKIPKGGGEGFGDRFGYGENTYNLGNFFPIAAVYDKNGWDIHPYDYKGDAFYSETSNFDIEITAPKDQVIASSGSIEGVKRVGGNKTWKIKAYAVRDFAFVSSDMFKVAEGKVNGIMVKSYAASSIKAKKTLEIGMDALRIFDDKFGKYPYPTCSIVQSDISGGMEYPNLVMIESNSYENMGLNNIFSYLIYGKPTGMLEDVVVHELGHQWWYGLVGDDEYREAWIDEPLTQYAALTYFKERYGQKEFDRIYGSSMKGQYDAYSRNDVVNPSLKRNLSEFEENEYYTLIYAKGTMMYKNLNDIMGDKKFNLLQRTMFNRYKYKVIKGDDLIKLTSEIEGRDMSDFYKKWLETSYAGE